METKSVFVISQKNFTAFCRFLIDYLKKKIGVSNNDFDTYIEIVKEKNLNIDKFIEDVVSDNTIKLLLKKSMISNTSQNFLQSKKCAQIIVLALIKCNNFNHLKNSLIILTGLSDRQVYRDVENYIPFLIKLNPNINIDKWLPREQYPPITYEDCVKVAEESDKNIKFAMTREEFNNAMENRGDNPPNRALLKWVCKEKGHEWQASYNNVDKGSGCPFCYGNYPITYEDCVKIAEESDKNIKFAMTREEFNNTIENRGDNSPNKVLLKWMCLNKNHEWWTSYSTIYKGSGCPNCGERKTVIGRLSHPILEYFSTIFFKLKGCSIRHEAYANTDSYEFVDLVIERDKNFINNIENSQKVLTIPDFITQILIDFTLSLNSDAIIEKCYRGYQSETRFLIIVLYPKENKSLLQEIRNLIQNIKDIIFREHVKVINFGQYLEFLNLIEPINSWKILSENEKNILQKFTYIIDLISDAFNSDEKLNKLIELSNHYKEQLYSYRL